MPIPSFYFSRNHTRPWNVARAAAYGAGIGVLASLLKTFGPLSHKADQAATHAVEVTAAAIFFALLCAGAAALRNLIARRLLAGNDQT
jgi:hypothetical protein